MSNVERGDVVQTPEGYLAIVEGPTASRRERVCAARKQAADAWQLLFRLHAACGNLERLCQITSEPTDLQSIWEARQELSAAMTCIGSVRTLLSTVKL